MTLDEAIEHAEEVGRDSCAECAEDHRQLADWLRELKTFREKALSSAFAQRRMPGPRWRPLDPVPTYPRFLVTELPPGFSTDEEEGAK